MPSSDQSVALSSLSKGCRARIVKTGKKPRIIQKLLSLGIRRGSIIEVLHRRSSGVVVCSDNNRVAIGTDIASELMVVCCTE